MVFLEVTSVAIGATFSLILYQCAVIVQRLYFSPLSAFPGPKLAAATYLVEIYYDIFKGEGGQLPFAHRKWHERYGPIIRINPDELHVQDSSWYETLYAASRPVKKLPNFGPRFNLKDSTVGTDDASLYRFRRGTLNNFFTKRKIAEFGPKVQEACSRVLARVQKEYQGTDRTLNLSHMFECLAADIVTSTTFGHDPGFIESPDFDSPINRATEAMTEGTKVMALFPVILTLVERLPKRLIAAFSPPMELLQGFFKGMEAAVVKAQLTNEAGKNDEKTLVGSLLSQKKIPPHEATTARLTVEARSVVGAGVETVARTLQLASFHILDQPAVRDRLVEELTAAIPDPSNMPDWNDLSRLPYLTACIEEAIRLTYGVGEKRSRAYDGGDLMYGEWRIPRGTFVSMNNYDVSHDEAIFPESFSFIPERWLEDPRAPDGKALSRYNVSFGKGMRSCVGMQLAYLELYIGIATFFRSSFALNAQVYQTDKSDLAMKRDVFVPRASKKSKGVRVVFQELEE